MSHPEEAIGLTLIGILGGVTSYGILYLDGVPFNIVSILLGLGLTFCASFIYLIIGLCIWWLYDTLNKPLKRYKEYLKSDEY